ncbi:hypothetical protein G9A89_003349 [Geosiphon pyriformis]|nr:hypothetical protein G9A89_003349 [Geosiphon pyriformis]
MLLTIQGKSIGAAAEYITLQKVAETLTKVMGKEHRFISLSKEETAKEAPDMAIDEFFDMVVIFGGDEALGDFSIAKELHPSITTFEQYAEKKYGKK